MADLLTFQTDILPGYRFDRGAGRYRSGQTGRFVGRRTIQNLMEEQVNGAQARMESLTRSFYDGNMDAPTFTRQMRTEARRLTLQSESLGIGGWDRLTSRQTGRAGGDLRNIYRKITGTADDIAQGKITQAQALNRARTYAGAGRSHYFEASRESRQRSASNMVWIERNQLAAGAEHCPDCLALADRGWVLEGSIPVPGTDRICGDACLCQLLSREIPVMELDEWIGTTRRA